MILIRPKYILTGLTVASLFTPVLPYARAQSAGTVRFSRRADNFYPSSSLQQWYQQHFTRMEVYSPSFDYNTWWYSNGLVYVDAYAIYTNSSLVWEHPEWILKDTAGNRLYIPWACSGGTCPQYAGDISNPAFRSYWISRTAGILGNGYKGLFIDDANMMFRVSDGWGNEVNPVGYVGWMSWDTWRSTMASYMEQVRSAFPNNEIVHNSIWFAGPDGIRDRDPSIQRMIRAGNYEYIEFGVNDNGLTGGTGIWSVDALFGYVDRVHAAGRGVIFSGVPADVAGREYALAGYFLISSGLDGLDDKVTTYDNWWTGFDVNLGTPSGGRYYWNNLMRRDFNGGMVLLNPPQSGWVTVNLPGTYKRIDGSWVSSVTLGPKQGVVLLTTSNTATGGSTTSSSGSTSFTSSGSTSGSTSSLSVSITYPSAGWTMARGPIELWSLASGAVSVSYYLNGTWIGTATGGGPYFHVWYNFSSWGPGWYTLTAVAQDSSGRTSSAPAVSLNLQ